MQKYLKILMGIILLISATFSQTIVEGYENFPDREKSLIICPIIIKNVGSEFKSEFPEIKNPSDSLFSLLNKDFVNRMRKNSKFRILYQSDYKHNPALSNRKLLIDKDKSMNFKLPEDSEKVSMKLLGRNPVKPDYLLFIKIGTINYTDDINLFLNVSGIISAISSGGFGGIRLSRKDGIVFEDFSYVYWDNKIGQVAVYNSDFLFLENADEDLFNPKENKKYLDVISRYLLTKTPFAKPDMIYYYIQ